MNAAAPTLPGNFEAPLESGAPWGSAQAVAIMLHGHDQSPEAMGELAETFGGAGVHFVMPRAPSGLWYPRALLAPIEENDAARLAAHAHVEALIADAVAHGIPLARIALGGFAQGACIVADLVLRSPRPFGGVILLTGALIDPTAIGRRPGSELLGVPVYVSGSEIDEDVPVERTHQTIRALQAGNAFITSHVFKGRPHLVAREELIEAHKVMAKMKSVPVT